MVLAVQPAEAGKHPCMIGPSVAGEVKSATPDILTIANDPRRFSLAHIVVPLPALMNLPQRGERVSIHSIAKNADRYERHAAHVLNGKTWMQGAALRSGAAVFTGRDNDTPCSKALVEAESVARRSKVGIWLDDAWPIATEDPEIVATWKGRFVVLAGKVQSVGDRATRLYLNFGQKWSQDVTAIANKKGRGKFRGSFDRLKRLSGKRVLLRGVVEESGGPLIRITHDGQIIPLD